MKNSYFYDITFIVEVHRHPENKETVKRINTIECSQ